MTDIHSVVRNLKSRKNEKENLKIYTEICCRDGALLAENSMVFNAVMLAEHIHEACPEAKSPEQIADTVNPEIAALVSGTADLLGRFYLDGSTITAEDTGALRRKNRACMEKLTDSVDLFLMTEYVMNRLEHRFEGEKQLPAGHSDMKYTDDILTSLSGEQNEGQNLKIARIAEQLPVRMTKVRFYDVIGERMSVYKESERAAFDNICALVRSALGISEKKTDDPIYGAVRALYEEMSRAKLSTVSEEEYRAYKARLAAVSAELNENMDLSQLLQDVLNPFEAVLITESARKQPDPDYAEELGTCEKIMRSTAKILNFTAEYPSDLLDAIYADCEKLEGVIERAEEQFAEDTGLLEAVQEGYGQVPIVEKLSVLLSNSSFADENAGRECAEEVGEEYYTDNVIKLEKDAASHFEGMNKQFVRAAMARFMSVLPPHFTSQEELEAYIYEALRSCTDTAEKLGCMDVIDSILKE